MWILNYIYYRQHSQNVLFGAKYNNKKVVVVLYVILLLFPFLISIYYLDTLYIIYIYVSPVLFYIYITFIFLPYQNY